MPKDHTSVFGECCGIISGFSKSATRSSRAIHLIEPAGLSETVFEDITAREIPKSQIKGWQEAEISTFSW